MDVKQAVRTANDYIVELFADEGIERVGLEEVMFDDTEDSWKVTVGFFRPWDRQRSLADALAGTVAEDWKKRTFKVVRIDDRTGHVVSVTHRTLRSSD